MTASKKNKPLTPWQKEDAKRLRAIFKAQSGSTKKSQQQIADENDWTQGFVSQVMLGLVAMNVKHAAGFARSLNCRIDDFSPTLAQDAAKQGALVRDYGPSDNFISIKWFKDVRLAAGSGIHIEDDGDVKDFALREDWVRSQGLNPKHLVAARADGPSMRPRIEDGDLLVINTSEKNIRNGKVYAFLQGKKGRVKRLYKSEKGLRIVSDNPDKDEFRDEFFPSDKTDTINIIGRVVILSGSV